MGKPEDWVDSSMMDDPEDKKPDDWVEEKRIVDESASKPDDWDDEEDGEWEFKEAKDVADHTLCHVTCGQNRTCHDSCPHSHWDEKKSQCMKYQEMVSCHKGCGGEHSCHAT